MKRLWKAILVVAALILSAWAGYKIAGAAIDPIIPRLYFPIAQQFNTKKGLGMAYWPTACEDLPAVRGYTLIGGHMSLPPCFKTWEFISSGYSYEFIPVFPPESVGVWPVIEQDPERPPVEWMILFNEPETCTGWFFSDCLEPDVAAGIVHNVIQHYPGMRFATPGMTGSPAGVAWLREHFDYYLSTYGPLPYEAVVYHCYDVDCISKTQAHLDVAQDYGIGEIWLTEYGIRPCYWGSAQAWQNSMRADLAYFNTVPELTRVVYHWNRTDPDWEPVFNCPSIAMEWETGELTDVGEIFAGWNHPVPSVPQPTSIPVLELRKKTKPPAYP